MSTIKKLTVSVNYEVDITDVNVTDETLSALREVNEEGNMIGSRYGKETPAIKIAQDFLVRHVRESYAKSHTFLILELE